MINAHIAAKDIERGKFGRDLTHMSDKKMWEALGI
jgi:hypothetical protein